MEPSVRLSGLEVADVVVRVPRCARPGVKRFSSELLPLVRRDKRSVGRFSDGLALRETPDSPLECEVIELGDPTLPWSFDCPSGRRVLPVGEILGRVARIGLGLRAEDRCIFALGGNGMASGDGEVTVAMVKKLSTEPLEGDCGDGESGDFGDGVGDREVMR
jgi:hypothetical protein